MCFLPWALGCVNSSRLIFFNLLLNITEHTSIVTRKDITCDCSLHQPSARLCLLTSLYREGQKRFSNTWHCWQLPEEYFQLKKKKRDRDPQSSINYKNPINFSLGFLPSHLPPFVGHWMALPQIALIFFLIISKSESLFRSLNASQIRGSHWAAERKEGFFCPPRDGK